MRIVCWIGCGVLVKSKFGNGIGIVASLSREMSQEESQKRRHEMFGLRRGCVKFSKCFWFEFENYVKGIMRTE